MGRASRRKYHIIYKTTCLITKRFYIGMHSTDNLEDGYIGSGKRLWHSTNKYGKENHVCEILEFLPNRDLLAIKEREIVSREFIKDPMCMNLMEGGSGGFISEEQQARWSSGGGKKAAIALKELRKNPVWVENQRAALSRGMVKAMKEGRHSPPSFAGKSHSVETILKMKESKKGHGIGSTNSQFGKCWITNEIESKKIMKGDEIPEG